MACCCAYYAEEADKGADARALYLVHGLVITDLTIYYVRN